MGNITNIDSMDRVKTYLMNLQNDPKFNDSLFRDYTCPDNCGACCHKVTLDWFPGSDRLHQLKRHHKHQYDRIKPRIVTFNGRELKVLSDIQEDNKTPWCRNLDLQTGRCKIYGAHPFPCDFELNKIIYNRRYGTYIGKRYYGRKWILKRITGVRGTLCEMIPYNEDRANKDIRLFLELQDIAIFFGLYFDILDKIVLTIQTIMEKNQWAITLNSKALNRVRQIQNTNSPNRIVRYLKILTRQKRNK